MVDRAVQVPSTWRVVDKISACDCPRSRQSSSRYTKGFVAVGGPGASADGGDHGFELCSGLEPGSLMKLIIVAAKTKTPEEAVTILSEASLRGQISLFHRAFQAPWGHVRLVILTQAFPLGRCRRGRGRLGRPFPRRCFASGVRRLQWGTAPPRVQVERVP